MELQKRKSNRLSGFDYSESGCYFITICTAEKKVLCNIVGCGIPDAPINNSKFDGLSGTPTPTEWGFSAGASCPTEK